MICLLALSEGKIRHWKEGKPESKVCEKFKVQEGFDILKFLGRWFEIFSYPFCVTVKSKCVLSIYGSSSTGRNFSTFSRFVDSNGVENRIIGSVDMKDNSIMSVTYPATRKFEK